MSVARNSVVRAAGFGDSSVLAPTEGTSSSPSNSEKRSLHGTDIGSVASETRIGAISSPITQARSTIVTSNARTAYSTGLHSSTIADQSLSSANTLVDCSSRAAHKLLTVISGLMVILQL